MAFDTLDLGITRGSGEAFWISAVSRLGAVHGFPQRDPNVSELFERSRKQRELVRMARPDRDFALETGQRLCNLVFSAPEIRVLFHRTRGAAADRGAPLLVR